MFATARHMTTGYPAGRSRHPHTSRHSDVR